MKQNLAKFIEAEQKIYLFFGRPQSKQERTGYPERPGYLGMITL